MVQVLVEKLLLKPGKDLGHGPTKGVDGLCNIAHCCDLLQLPLKLHHNAELQRCILASGSHIACPLLLRQELKLARCINFDWLQQYGSYNLVQQCTACYAACRNFVRQIVCTRYARCKGSVQA